MSSLLLSLPPLSPDYSGVASTMHDLRALTVIHDASGCTGTYAGYDEPRWFGSRSPIFCSGLRELDATMGDDDKLLSKIEAVVKEAAPPLISVVGSPVPMVVGFDFDGFCSLVESRTGIPAVGFPADGLSLYDEGQTMAYAALERLFVADTDRRGGVNILGASPLDDIDGPAVGCLAALAAKAGLELVSVWGSRSGLGELSRAGEAAVNWVTAAAALPLALRLRERFGTPFVVGLPVGESEERRLIGALASAAKETPRSADAPSLPAPGSEPRPRLDEALEPGATVVVAEAVCAASIAACLRDDLGSGPVIPLTMFVSNGMAASVGVAAIQGEAELAAVLADPRVTRLIGDPLFARLAPPSKDLKAMPLPHRAVSARLYRDSRSRLFGSRGVSIFEAFLGGNHG